MLESGDNIERFVPSSVSNNSGFSYLNQLQDLYSKPYKGTNHVGDILANTINDTATEGVKNIVSETQDVTSLSADALKILQNLNSGKDDNNVISKLLGGSGGGNAISELLGGTGSDNGIAELFNSSFAADPLSKAILSQATANIKQSGTNLLKQERSEGAAANDPIQKVLKAYQAYNNNDNSSAKVVDEVA